MLVGGGKVYFSFGIGPLKVKFSLVFILFLKL